MAFAHCWTSFQSQYGHHLASDDKEPEPCLICQRSLQRMTDYSTEMLLLHEAALQIILSEQHVVSNKKVPNPTEK